jgi:hypothetical protein
MSLLVRWIHPVGLTADYSETKVFKSGAIQGPYNHLRNMKSFDENSVPITQFEDPTGRREYWYVIRFYTEGGREFDDYMIGFFPPTPREKLIIGYVVGWVPEMLKPDLSDFDVQYALKLALNDFNVHPPETSFTISTFPENYEQYLVVGAEINIMYQKFLKVAIRDFTYSDSGLSLGIDRGAKIKQAEDDLKASYFTLLEKAKWNFTPAGVGIGTVPLPIGIGASINRGVMSILDIFNLMGR